MLHSFCDFNAGVKDEIWDLFEKWEKVDEPFEYVLEIIDAATAGRIDLDNFNLAAYNKTIKKNENKVGNRRKNKILRITEDIDEAGVEPYAVPEAVVSLYAEQVDEYEKLENAEELKFAVKELRTLSVSILYDYRIDLFRCMQQALKGIPNSIKLLQELVNADPYIGSLIKIVLKSEKSLSELFPEIAERRRYCANTK